MDLKTAKKIIDNIDSLSSNNILVSVASLVQLYDTATNQYKVVLCVLLDQVYQKLVDMEKKQVRTEFSQLVRFLGKYHLLCENKVDSEEARNYFAILKERYNSY